MAYTSQYISTDVFRWLLDDLNIVYDGKQQDDLLMRAVGDLEADLSKKFKVPLINATGVSFCAAPDFARNKVLNALKAKIRQLIGTDKNRNLVIESTEKYIDTHKIEYKDNINVLLDPMIDFGFLLLGQAVDAQTPVQHVALGRADNETELAFDKFSIGY